MSEGSPPVINFVKRPMEMRDASIKAGYPVWTDVDYIEIIPVGSNGKTVVTYVYTEWLKQMQHDSISNPGGNQGQRGMDYNPSRFPEAWLQMIEKAYAEWTKTGEVPLEGTPIKNWPVVTPAQRKMAEAGGYRTVEELADANEEGIMRIGMGGRHLSGLAKNWMKAKNDPASKTAAALSALETENEQAREQISDQAQLIQQLSGRLAALERAAA